MWLSLVQVAELQKHNEDLIMEMEKVRRELEKTKPGKAKKKPSDADDPSKVCSAMSSESLLSRYMYT